MRRLMFPALLALAVAGGCAGTTSGGYYASASYTTPDLVYVSPGVQVIADYDEPIFYSDGYYWRYYGDTWYRSHSYTGGWAYARPPRAVLQIDRPYAYRHYRPSGYVTRRDRPSYRDNRDYRRPRPVVRDHRDYRAAPRQRSAPVYRDTRRDNRRAAPVYRGEQRAVPRARPAPQRDDRARTRGRDGNWLDKGRDARYRERERERR